MVTYNLGTGKGTSVLQMVDAFKQASGVKIPYIIVDRRPGDAAECYADATLAEQELSWKAEFSIKKCVKILGDGNQTTQMDTKTNSSSHLFSTRTTK